MVTLGNDWDGILAEEFQKDYYKILRGFLKHEYSSQTVYPSMYDIFNAFKATPYKDVKIVIIGQDPYHQPSQAHGMCFSVNKGVRLPPSLRNIYREISADLGIRMGENGYLMPWAKQGVLLLNTILTVRRGQPMSHAGYGWETFTDAVLRKLSARTEPIIFMLWGAPAGKKAALIDEKKHVVLRAAHPSPLSAHNGFFGCKHFSKANELLVKWGREPINWQIL